MQHALNFDRKALRLGLKTYPKASKILQKLIQNRFKNRCRFNVAFGFDKKTFLDRFWLDFGRILFSAGVESIKESEPRLASGHFACFQVLLECIWDPFGTVLEPFWEGLGTILGSFREVKSLKTL